MAEINKGGLTMNDKPQEDKKNKPAKSLTHSQRKILNAGMAIFDKPATSKESVFMARELVQCTLPHRNPGDVPTWSRKNGNLTLIVQPGYKQDSSTGEHVCIGFPYGSLPRLLLFWMITEAVRTKNRRLQLGSSLRGFMLELGLDSRHGGKRGDAQRLREQMERLFRAKFSFEKKRGVGVAWFDMQVAPRGQFWWDEKDPSQIESTSWIELGHDFYDAVIASPVPVDMRALRALKQSPLALDLYAWLSYEAFIAHKSGESRFTSFERLHEQLGGDYTDLDDFRKKAVKPALAKIHLVYPKLKLGKRQGGIEILPESFPSIQPKGETIDGTATHITEPPPLPKYSPKEETLNKEQLKPATIEKFRHLYPRLDPYECKQNFDAWLKTDGTEQPKNYNAAFLGFAKKWTLNKF